MARTLGATVAELQQRMSAGEYREWIEYYKLEPFGDDWDQAAEISYTIAATSGRVKTGRLKRDDFKPTFNKKTRKPHQSPEQMQKVFERFAMAHNKAIGSKDASSK